MKLWISSNIPATGLIFRKFCGSWGREGGKERERKGGKKKGERKGHWNDVAFEAKKLSGEYGGVIGYPELLEHPEEGAVTDSLNQHFRLKSDRQPVLANRLCHTLTARC